MKHLWIIVAATGLVLKTAVASGQFHDRPPRGRLTLSIANLGCYHSDRTNLISWVHQHGAFASKLNFGGDYFRVFYNPTDVFGIGTATGIFFSSDSRSGVDGGYGELILQTSVARSRSMRLNINGHFTALGYSLKNAVPDNVTPAFSGFYMRGVTVGAGPSLELQVTCFRRQTWSGGFGTEAGVSFDIPDAGWRYGYDYMTSAWHTRYKSVPVSGPKVEPLLAYAKVSFFMNFGK